ncbi:MAG: L,D-transpeptidase [bacterium]|nr:L,D-transpeptidase [bacterium]
MPPVRRLAWPALLCLLAATGAAAMPAVPYRFEPPRTALAKRSAAELALLEKLNRADRAHLPRLDVVVVPDDFADDGLTHSPMPAVWPAALPYPTAIAVDVPGQVFGAYAHGVLVRWGPVSTGRRGSQTPAGDYHLNWKSKGRHSTVDAEWFMPWYFNFASHDGLAFHQFALPGRPASHSCVRMLERDARWLFAWGHGWILGPDRKVLAHGTPVAILGAYDFAAPPPWRSAAWLSRPVTLPLALPATD